MTMSSSDSEKNRLSHRILKIVIGILVPLAVAFNILALIFASVWIQQPFLTTFFYPNLIVNHSYNPNWEARQVGIVSADQIVAVDGQSIASGRSLYTTLNQKEIGDQVTVSIEPGAETYIITLTEFASSDAMIFFWLPYIIGLIYFALGFAVYRLRRAERVSRAFIVFCVFISIMMGGLFDFYTLHFLAPLWAAVFPFVAASLLHLAFVFPVETRLARRHPMWRFIAYGIALILAIANLYSIYLSANPRSFLTIQLLDYGFIGFSVLLFFGLLINTRLTTFSAIVKQQTTIILVGSIIGFGPIAFWTLANAIGFSIPFSETTFALVFAPLIIFPISLAYATLRYRLLDTDIVFNRSVVYTLLTLLVTLSYFLIVSFLSLLLPNNEFARNPILLAVFIFGLVIFLQPVQQRLQRMVNHFFLRDTFDSQAMLQRYGEELVETPLDIDLVLDMLLKQTGEAFAPERMFVFLKDTTQGSFVIRSELGQKHIAAVEVKFGLDDDLAEWLTRTGDTLQISPTGTALGAANISQEELARLNMLDVALCAPLIGSTSLLGWVALSLKKSGQPYHRNDLLFLDTLVNQTTIALENAQLLAEASQRVAELEALQNISIELQSEAEPDLLLSSVVGRATHLLRAEGGLVYLLEPDGEQLKVVISHNLGKDYTGSVIGKSDDIGGHIITTGKPLVVDNYANFPHRSDTFQDAKFGGLLAVPLQWGGQVRGVLQLVHGASGSRFKEEDLSLMELFATQSALALEKSRLLKEAQQRADQLATLSDVSIAISSTLNLETALERVMHRAVEILQAEAGSLLLVDKQGRNLSFEVVLGPTGSDLLGVKIPIGTGIVGSVAQTAETLIINDVAADPRFEVAFDEASDFKTEALICVPMIAHNNVVGVIEVINKRDGTVFTAEDQNLLMSFAAQAAIAIENAQLFTRTDQALAERIQELQTLQMFDQALQTSLELSTVLEISLTHIMDSLGVIMGTIGIIDVDDEGEEGLYLLAQHGLPTEMGRYKIDPWPLTRGIIGRVARTGQLACVNDITQTSDYIPKNHRARSLLVAPILREERVIGVIDLESTDVDYFTDDDISFVRLLLSHAAIAIENAQLFDQVKEANDSKTEFMNIASHELKIPMTSIKGYARLLEMGAGGALTDQQKEFLGVITNNVDRMSGLVNDLLDVSRIEAGRIRLEIQDVQIEDVIDEVIRSVDTQIKNKKLDLSIEMANDLPELRADYNRMIQILTNLVSNAYKYTPDGGSIKVMAQAHNGDIQGIEVTVADTGFGISEEDQAKLFNTFFRSSDQNIRNEPGTGLGLSITKKMIESHGGEFMFESELGKGSAFTFTLPRVSQIPPGVEVIQK
ncbi:MAG: GAF domain-containing protein [Chloroflexota bacterium]